MQICFCPRAVQVLVADPCEQGRGYGRARFSCAMLRVPAASLICGDPPHRECRGIERRYDVKRPRIDFDAWGAARLCRTLSGAEIRKAARRGARYRAAIIGTFIAYS